MQEKTTLEYWLTLYNRKWLILFVIISAMITAGIISFVLPPVYEAKAVFFVPEKPDVMSFLSPSTEALKGRSRLVPQASEEPHAPYLGILKSRRIRELVREDFPYKSIEDLRKDIDVNISSEYLIEVYARDRDPGNAAGIANAFVKNLNHLLAGYTELLSKSDQSMLETEIVAMREKLNKARLDLKDFRERHGIIDLNEEKRQLVTQKNDFLTKFKTTKVAQRENEMKISALKEELEKEAELFISSELIYGSPLLNSLRIDLANVEVKMSALRVDVRESHPDFISLKKQYNKINEKINSEVERLAKNQIKLPDTLHEELREQIVNLLVDRERLQASLQAYQTVIESIESKIHAIPKLIAQIDSLKTDIEKYKNMVRSLETNLEEMKMQRRRDLHVVLVVEEAEPPAGHSFPILWLNVFIAGISGLIFGIFYCFFSNYLEETREQRIYKILKTIKTVEE